MCAVFSRTRFTKRRWRKGRGPYMTLLGGWAFEAVDLFQQRERRFHQGPRAHAPLSSEAGYMCAVFSRTRFTKRRWRKGRGPYMPPNLIHYVRKF